jgi:hypothetical protein
VQPCKIPAKTHKNKAKNDSFRERSGFRNVDIQLSNGHTRKDRFPAV